jgi:hypothetical protein
MGVAEEEANMVAATCGLNTTIGPKKKRYDESGDEPPKLVENESVEVERETPADDNESVEQIEDSKKSNSPAFEE